MLIAIGCGAPAHDTPPPAAPPPAPAAPAPHAAPPDAAPPADAPALSRSFVEVELGLDLRALPTHSTPGMIDMYVLGQGDDLRNLAPAGVAVEIRHVPGWGVLYARFRAPDPAVARDACAKTVAAYLAHAPDLPVIHTPGAQVTTPCHDATE